ncbi:Enzyme that catalyzes the fourth step in the histidine pathway [Podochytrium sp. JEL0797]|nr:Enzyme that catalyzes the fourth step in the histidine pathway [Podochytrium sp. JEL0797]
MTFFRPCIDLHSGQVKQIVGASLKDDPTSSQQTDEKVLRTNFVSSYPSAHYAEMYKKHNLTGAHVIKLGPGNDQAALEALAAWPGGLQLGGGISIENAEYWLNEGKAGKIIVTSWLFPNARFSEDRLKQLCERVGKDRIVVDISCKVKDGEWIVAMDKWQTLTDMRVDADSIRMLEAYCSEFLVHAADVEGLCKGIDARLVEKLGEWCTIPVTYAGGGHAFSDLELVDKLSAGKVDLTFGSALDIFGGNGVKFDDCMDEDAIAEVASTCKRLLTSFALGKFSLAPGSPESDSICFLSSPRFLNTHEIFQELHRELADQQLTYSELNTAHLANAERDAKIARIISRLLRAVQMIEPTPSIPAPENFSEDVRSSIGMPTTPHFPSTQRESTSFVGRRLHPHRASSLTLYEDSVQEEETREIHLEPSVSPMGCVAKCQCETAATDAIQSEKDLATALMMAMKINELICDKIGVEVMDVRLIPGEPLIRQISTQLETMYISLLKHKPEKKVALDVRDQGHQTEIFEDAVPIAEPPLPTKSFDIWESSASTEYDLLSTINASLKGLGSEWGLDFSSEMDRFGGEEVVPPPADKPLPPLQPNREQNEPCIKQLESSSRMVEAHPLLQTIQTSAQRLHLHHQSLKTHLRHTLLELEIHSQDALLSLQTRYSAAIAAIQPKSPHRVALEKEKEQLKREYIQICEKRDTFESLVSELSRDVVRLSRQQLPELIECRDRTVADLKAVVYGVRAFQSECEELYGHRIEEMKTRWKQTWEIELQGVVAEQRFLKEVESGVGRVCGGELEDLVQKVQDLMELQGDEGMAFKKKEFGRDRLDEDEDFQQELNVVLAMQAKGRMEALRRSEMVQRLREECRELFVKAELRPFERELKEKVSQFFHA